MLMEIYYEHYAENCRDRYWELEKLSVPYMVLFPTVYEMHCFMDVLRRDGLRCVESNYEYRTLLVNLELKRFAVIRQPCKYKCVNDHNYTPEEFISEVYKTGRTAVQEEYQWQKGGTMKINNSRSDGEKRCELRDAAFDHYSYNQPLVNVYHLSNDRIKAYLSLLFVRSYTLFVLHDGEVSSSFLPDLKDARTKLTDEDLKKIASTHKLISEKDCINQIMHGDTMDVLEWEIPGGKNGGKKIGLGEGEDLPHILREWIESARLKYQGMNLQAEYYLKFVYISFKYDEVWYELDASGMGVNREAFDYIAYDLVQGLRSIGARWAFYHGQLD